jgi:hypothetical protein
MRQRAVERDRQGADFRGRAQTQVDPEDVTLAGLLAQQLENGPRVTLRGLGRLVALAARKEAGIVEQDRMSEL